MSEYGLKETNDLVKLIMKIGLLIAETKKEHGKFSDFVEKLKNSPEKEEAFDNIGDVLKEIMDANLDDLPEAFKLVVGDFNWLRKEIKKLKKA